jgi:hypothetical protein
MLQSCRLAGEVKARYHVYDSRERPALLGGGS